MSEDRLRELLRDAALPEEREAEERGLRIVAAAFRERRVEPRPRPRARLRLALVLTSALALLALILSPAGAAVRDWIGDVFEPGVEHAEPALTRLPGGGELLVQSPQGPWLVHGDGSRRLLGDYGEATWSPHGLFVAVTAGRTLSAVEPGGDVRWSLSRDAVLSDPRWAPSGFRIAYRAGRAVRVVAGDGSGDDLLYRRAAAVVPAWRPGPGNALTLARTPFDVRVTDVDSGRQLGAYRAPHRVEDLQWSGDGRRLLVASGRSVTVLDRDLSPVARWDAPAKGLIGAAALAPDRSEFATVVRRPAPFGPPRSEVLVTREGGRTRSIFAAPGTFTDIAWSPDGRRLLVAWREADQWLFIPVRHRSRVIAVDGISGQFSPGAERAAFPRVEADGWCCAR